MDRATTYVEQGSIQWELSRVTGLKMGDSINPIAKYDQSAANPR